MNKQIERSLPIALGVMFLVSAAALLWADGVNMTRHSGDGLHLLGILEHMRQGGLLHHDISTPIGRWAFSPILIFLRQGISGGEAFLYGQLLVSLIVTPLAWLTLRRRFEPIAATGLVFVIMATVMAMVQGGADPGHSISMHYNRWAWGYGFLAVGMAVAAPAQHRWIEGLVPGGLMVAMAMTKATYFLAFAPVVIVAGLSTGQRALLGVAVITGLVALAAMTALWGVGYWADYAGDLLTVAASDIRSFPGLSLNELIVSPAYIPVSGIVLALVIGLRKAGLMAEGLVLLLLAPAGIYVTFQNFGNDALWLGFAAILIAGWARQKQDQTRLWLGVGALSLAIIILPTFINMAISPVRHALGNSSDYVRVLAGTDWHQDLRMTRGRAGLMTLKTPQTEGITRFDLDPLDPPKMFKGDKLADCTSELVPSVVASAIADLKEQDLAQGQSLFVMDLTTPHWLYGDHPPLKGGAQWYYGGLPGYENADYVFRPLCPSDPSATAIIAEALEDKDLEVVARRPLYVLYRPIR